MKACPNCGSHSFIVTAHVVQEWVVDENGDFLRCIDECVEVLHQPNDDDIWSCNNCGLSEAGGFFNERVT